MPSKVERVIGIDPGYDRLGVSILEKSPGKKETVIFSCCITTNPKKDIFSRFKEIGEQISILMDDFQPKALAIETLFITKNQKTAMRVAEARGIIIYEAIKRKIPVHEYGPMEIKMAVTGDGSSDKSRIIKMIHMLVSVSKDKKLDDEYDAIAVALTYFAQNKSWG